MKFGVLFCIFDRGKCSISCVITLCFTSAFYLLEKKAVSAKSAPETPSAMEGETTPTVVEGETTPTVVEGETTPTVVEGETTPTVVEGEKEENVRNAQQAYVTPLEVQEHLRRVWQNDEVFMNTLLGSYPSPSATKRKSSFQMFFLNVVPVPPSRFRPVRSLNIVLLSFQPFLVCIS